MVASRRLGAQRGIPEDVLKQIDQMHVQNEALIRKLLELNAPVDQARELLTYADFDLQLMWGFPMDGNLHTLFKDYMFRREWYGRKFKCMATGEVLTIPADVQEGDYFQVGYGGIDVGRAGAYSRQIGNIIEVEG